MFCIYSGRVHVAIHKLLLAQTIQTVITTDHVCSKLYPHTSPMSKAVLWQCDPDIYDYVRDHNTLPCDRFEHQISSVGNTSLASDQLIKHQSTGRVYVKSSHRLLWFDEEKKKVVKLEKLKDVLNDKLSSESPSLGNITVEPPGDKCFTTIRTVEHHQVDPNNHLAAPCFIIMAADGIEEANNQGFFNKNNFDITTPGGMRIVNLKLLHQGEALLGDTLTYHIWSDVSTIYIQVTKGNHIKLAYIVLDLNGEQKSRI